MTNLNNPSNPGSVPVSPAKAPMKSMVHASWASEGITSFFAGTFVCIVKKNKQGKDALHFMILPSFSKKYGTTSYKVPGGDDNQDFELPSEAAVREWQEETMKEYSKASLPVGAIKLIFFKDLPDEKHPGGKHRKSFWLLPLRLLNNFYNDRVHFRTEDKPDGDDILGAIELEDVAVLVGGKLYKTHLHALAMAIRELAKIDVVFDVMPDGLLQWAMLPDHVDFKRKPIYFVPQVR